MDRRHFIKSASVTLLATMNPVIGTGQGKTAKPAGRMNYRRLGRTGMNISEISLGGSPVPSEAIFHRAIELGVNYVDTSSSYMNGNSERTIGKVLKDHPGKLFVATKIHAGRRGQDTIESWEKEFEGSLKRLDIECVDILMVHGARTPDILANEDVLNLFEKYKKQGKIRFRGVSCHTDPLEVLSAAIKSGNWDMVSVAYNAFSGSLVQENGVYEDYLQKSGIEQVINLAKKHDVGVIAMKTMAGGNRQDLGKYRRKGISLPQAKLKWVLENKYVAAALSELLSFDILEENLAVSGSPLKAKEKTALLTHVAAHSSRYCRMCGVCSKECPRGIAVPDILRYALYYTDHGKTALATDKYRALPADLKYDACNHCGRCSDVCPNKLPVTRMLQTAHQLLG
jgi:predicted aldo/keto reductase-like oxidoreductase